jgi:redox-sensitive bicupin YhaK (pirin superfamily)
MSDEHRLRGAHTDRTKDNAMDKVRNIKKIIKAHKTMEGAGVLLHRAIGFDDPYQYDPFLLFDDFRSDTPADFIKGFPWHPHRGIETITYVIKGDVTHEDSLGNKGTIGEGDVQWMTAGSGIYHQEMPLGDGSGRMYGFQLWANLPKKQKMIDPKYRGVLSKDIPEAKRADGINIKVIAGDYEGVKGPIGDIAIDPEYYDIAIPKDTEYIQRTIQGNTVLFYVFEGNGYIESSMDGSLKSVKVENRNMVFFDDGQSVKIRTLDSGIRFLMISGKPLHEPIAWHGPIVMNTDQELRIAYDELEKGTFVKAKKREL